MPQQTRHQVLKPQHEKSPRELRIQERKRTNGLFGKAHQLFVKCDAKIALIVQYPQTGRTISYYSDESWPSGDDLEALLDPTTETLSTSDFTDSGKRISGGSFAVKGGDHGGLHTSHARPSNHHDSDLQSISAKRAVSLQAGESPSRPIAALPSRKRSWRDVVLQ